MALGYITVKDSNSAPRNFVTHLDAAGSAIPAHSLDAGKPTYRFAGSFTPQATAAVTVLAVKGSASKTVRVKSLKVGGTSTAAGSTLLGLQRTSALGAGGTVVAPTAAKMDSAFAAATAVVEHYTTTLKAAGTAAGGPVAQKTVATSIVTLPTTGPVAMVEMLDVGACALVLRGTADILELQNLNAGNLPGGTIYQYVVELEEDAS